MESANRCYPDYLNPFGSDEEGDDNEERGNECTITKSVDEYPDYLSPFDDIDEQEAGRTHTANKTTEPDDYDDSLNPFGDDEEQSRSQKANKTSLHQQVPEHDDLGEGNPFAEDLEVEPRGNNHASAVVASDTNQHLPSTNTDIFNQNKTTSEAIATTITAIPSHEQETPEKPPVPLPRTKSLLKKELAAQRMKQLQLQQQQQNNLVEKSNYPTRSSKVIEEKNDSLLEE